MPRGREPLPHPIARRAWRKYKELSSQLLPSLPDNLVQNDPCGHRDIERRHLAQHGDRCEEVTLLPHQIMQTLAFAAEDHGAIHVVIERVIGLGAALIETYDPQILCLE